MKPSVYLETSVISYLAAQPSRDLLVAAHQHRSHTWWKERRTSFDMYVSQLVLDEANSGDEDAAARRAAYLNGLPLLDATADAISLADALLRQTRLPSKAAADALHIAIAAYHGVEYLLTWNCRHIANAVLRPGVEAACRTNGFVPPVVCTPDELIVELDDDPPR